MSSKDKRRMPAANLEESEGVEENDNEVSDEDGEDDVEKDMIVEEE